MAHLALDVIKIPGLLHYGQGLELQRRFGAELEESSQKTGKLLLLQHAPVYTLGRKTADEHLPFKPDELAQRTGAEVVSIDRGGSVTYHGPGQLVAYLLLNLRVWNIPIHAHLDRLEAVAIGTLARYGLPGYREEGMTGAWVDVPRAGRVERAKICAIGVSARRWVTYHGLSFNVDLDLAPFSQIIPCGLQGKPVTTLAEALGRKVVVADVQQVLAAEVARIYEAS